MDLIDRKAAVKALEFEKRFIETETRKDGIDDAIDAITLVSSVSAVPLEPLCRYLEVYARTPVYNLRHTAEWWKEELEKVKWEKWMEGLDAVDRC